MNRKSTIRNALNLAQRDLAALVIKYDYLLKGDLKHTFTGQNSDIQGIKMINPNRIVISRDSGVLEIWNLKTFKLEKTLDDDLGFLYNTLLITQDKIISGAPSLRIWDLNTYEYSSINAYGNDKVSDIFELSDNRIFVASKYAAEARIYNLDNNQLEAVITDNDYGLIQSSLATEGRILIIFDTSLKLFDEQGNLLSSLNDFNDISEDIKGSLLPLSNKRILKTTYEGIMTIVSYANDKLQILDSFNVVTTIYSVKMLSDELVATYSFGCGRIVVYNINSHESVLRIPKDISDINMLPDNTIITSSTEGEIKIWNSDKSGRFFNLEEEIKEILVLRNGILVTSGVNLYLFE